MALITLPVGNVLVPWIGPTTTLAGQSWFTTTNLAGVYKPSSNRAGFVSCKPGAAFPGFTQVVATAAGQVPEAYLFIVKVAFQLDSSLIGQPVLSPSQLVASFPINSTGFTVALKVKSVDAGSYVLDSANPSVALTNISYQKNGSTITLTTSTPVTLTTSDTLVITGTTGGIEGEITLIKQ